MAKRRRTSVEIQPRTLRDLAGDLDDLSERSLKRVLYGSLDDVSEDANRRLSRVFDRQIEGGPTDFTRILPGSKTSSVVNNRAQRSGRRILSTLQVQRRQSTYLKYALGDEADRDAGDVGAAEAHVFVPNEDNLSKSQGIRLTGEGNMPRNALKTLVKRSKPRGLTKTGKRRKPGRFGGVFFGKAGRGSTMGFWQRSANDGEEKNRAPSLLVLAVPRARYDDDNLQRGWNKAVGDAMDEIPSIVRKRLAAVLARM